MITYIKARWFAWRTTRLRGKLDNVEKQVAFMRSRLLAIRAMGDQLCASQDERSAPVLSIITEILTDDVATLQRLKRQELKLKVKLGLPIEEQQ